MFDLARRLQYGEITGPVKGQVFDFCKSSATMEVEQAAMQVLKQQLALTFVPWVLFRGISALDVVCFFPLLALQWPSDRSKELRCGLFEENELFLQKQPL